MLVVWLVFGLVDMFVASGVVVGIVGISGVVEIRVTVVIIVVTVIVDGINVAVVVVSIIIAPS